MRQQAIDFRDIQGLVRGYGRSLPEGKFLLLTICSADKFRDCLRQLPLTSMESWPDDQAPAAVTNIAFSYAGLAALGLPTRLLGSFPEDFRQGMKRRKRTNADIGSSDPSHWESCWQGDLVHAWIGVYARDLAALQQRIATIKSLDPAGRAFTVAAEQDVHVVKAPTQAGVYPDDALIEHFGFVDGVGNPAIEGISRPQALSGTKLDPERDRAGWQPLAPGEFLLGHYKDEADEQPDAPAALQLATNGTFMVYRKLQQDVPGFWSNLAQMAGAADLDPIDLAEHMVGRYLDGRPLIKTSDGNNDFRYGRDPHGEECPVGAHIRRTNPRDQFGFGTVLVDRHRLLRRGIPYGPAVDKLPEKARGDVAWDDGDRADRGLIFISLNASISRQFEFVQKRWLNDGDVFRLGQEGDPITGTRTTPGQFRLSARKQGAGREQRVTICPGINQFVTMRGGEYFFLPGLGATRYLADGLYNV